MLREILLEVLLTSNNISLKSTIKIVKKIIVFSGKSKSTGLGIVVNIDLKINDV